MKRSTFLRHLGLGLGTLPMTLSQLHTLGQDLPKAPRQPVLFIGHGSPMNAIQDNAFTQSLRKMGHKLGHPQAVLVVSAHWLSYGTWVGTTEKPETIYDFGGFPKALYEVSYPAPGAPDIARSVAPLALPTTLREDHERGLDHGVWTILKFLFPEANIPVFQLSIDARMSPQGHVDLAQRLSALRDRGVLMIGSGNIVHNLGEADFHNVNATPADWALEFDHIVAQGIAKGDFASLINLSRSGTLGRQAHPTDDHYLPLLYTLGAVKKGEAPHTFFEAIHHGTVSMRCVAWGLA